MNRLAILVQLTALVVFASATDECAQLRASKVYSDAYFVAEAGDVVGKELALKHVSGKTYQGLLYIYEGVPNNQAIPLTGTLNGADISLQGDWRQDLVEHPSNRHITNTKHLELDGRLSERNFRGSFQIDGNPSPISLRRVSYIWLCKPQKPSNKPR